MKHEVLVWHAEAEDVFSREEAVRRSEKTVQIGNPYRKIEDGAFKNNIKLHHVVLDRPLEEIGQESFAGCTSLRRIEMESVKKIRKEAFYNCTRLQNAELSSVSCLGPGCFALCKRLTAVSFAERNECREISREAFAECENLEDIVLPEGILSVENKAFYKCTSLKEVQLPKSLVQIGTEAFAKCKELESMTVPENVKSIGDRAFHGCSRLKILEIQGDLEYAGKALVNKTTKIRCKKDSETEKILKNAGFEVDILHRDCS